MGLFDDLIPTTRSGGLFDDLIPADGGDQVSRASTRSPEPPRAVAPEAPSSVDVGEYSPEQPTAPSSGPPTADYPDQVSRSHSAVNEGANALTDIGRNLGVGAVQAVQGVNEAARKLTGPIGEIGDYLFEKIVGRSQGEVLKDVEASYKKGLSDEAQFAAQKKWATFDDPAWADPNAWSGGIAQSLPSMAITMGPASIIGRAAFATKLAHGATVAEAGAAAGRAAMYAGGAGEGLISGGGSSAQIRDSILDMKPEQLAQSDAYTALVRGGMEPKEAQAKLANDASAQAFVLVGVTSALFGGQGDRFLAKIITEGVGKSVFKRFVGGMAAEGLMEEMPQSVTQQMGENIASMAARPETTLMQGTGEAAVSGAALGGIMGGGMGLMGHNRSDPAERAAEDAKQRALAKADFGFGRQAPVAPPPAAPQQELSPDAATALQNAPQEPQQDWPTAPTLPGPENPTGPTPPPAAAPAPVDAQAVIAQAVAPAPADAAPTPAPHQIEIDPANPAASIAAIAAAPLPTINPDLATPAHLNETTHADAAGSLADTLAQIHALRKQADNVMLPMEQRKGIKAQIATLTDEAASQKAAYAETHGIEAAAHMHTVAARTAGSIRGGYKAPAVPTSKPVQEKAVSTEREQPASVNTEPAKTTETGKVDGRITVAKDSDRLNALKAKAKAIIDRTGGDLTGPEAEEFKAATREIVSIRYDRGRPDTAADITATPEERKSTLTPETTAVISADVWRSKPIYEVINEAAAGVHFNADTAVDEVFDGKNKDISARQMYDAFAGTRAALKQQYGPTITLYRSEGKQKQKTTQNWATTREFAAQYGGNVVERQVPVEDVLAAHVAGKGRYHELIVGSHLKVLGPKPVQRQERTLTKPEPKKAVTVDDIAWFLDDNGKPKRTQKLRAFGPLIAATKRGTAQAETSAGAHNAQLLHKAVPGEVKTGIPGHARNTTPDEKKLLAAVMRDSYKSGMPTVVLSGLGDIHVYNPRDDMEDARHWIMGNGDTTMGFREDLVQNALAGHAPSLAAIKHYFDHETGHELDSAQAVSDNYASSQSPLFTIRSTPGGRKATGPVVSEVKNVFFGTKNSALKEYLGYPMSMWDMNHSEMEQPSEEMAVQVLQAETFAQLLSLWYNNRALMQEHLPQSHAMMKELHERLDRIPHDGRADRAVAEAVHRTLRTGLVTDSKSADGPRSRRKAGPRFGEREADSGVDLATQVGSKFDAYLASKRSPGLKPEILTPVSKRLTPKQKAAEAAAKAAADALNEKVSQSRTSDALVYREKNEKPLGTKSVEVDDVGHHFDKLIADEFGGPLDYNNPAHVERAVRLMRQEFRYQLAQAKSGLDWYSEDIKGAFEMTATIIPELHNELHRQLFGVTTALMSPGTKAHDNWNYGAIAYQKFTETGLIPETKPEEHGGELWGVYGATTAKAIGQVNSMIAEMGRGPATEWLMTHHTVQEINRMKHKFGYYKDAPVGGKMLDLQLGVYMFGEKVGPFALNVLGIDTEVTVDVWLTRTFNRHFGTMFHDSGKKAGEMRESPSEPERRVIKGMIESVAKSEGYSNSQVQAVLWFFEQGVYTQLGAASPSMTFSDGARVFLANQNGATNGPADSESSSRAPEDAAGDGEAVPKQATLADFAKGKVESLLNKDGWIVMSADKESATAVDNKRAGRQLESDLKAMGLTDYQKVVGRYGAGDENSLVITGITPAQADSLRDKYGQDSYLDRRGFVHSDGTVTPAKSITAQPDDASDYYTIMPSGFKWAADMDFDARGAPDAELESRFPRGMAARSMNDRLEGLPASSPGPNEVVHTAAARYAEQAGIDYRPPTTYVKVDPAYSKRIADAYEQMKHAPDDPEVKAAYRALIDETLAQWDVMMKNGVKVEFASEEHPYPYKSPYDAVRDIRDNNHMWVFPTDGGFGHEGSGNIDSLSQSTKPGSPEHVSQVDDVEKFTAAASAARAGRKFGPVMGEVSAAKLKGARMFMSSDGKSGFAISPDGDLLNTFSSAKGRFATLMEAAKLNGVKRVDTLDTGIVEMYKSQGFTEDRREAWDDQYAPAGWDESLGEPDHVYLTYKKKAGIRDTTHPLLERTGITVGGRDLMANDVFRAVHDYFGHAADGVGFRADGEENAWRAHSAMFTPLARRALTTETRGQNSWVNFGPYGEQNKTASETETRYADQKAGLLPEEFSEDRYEKPRAPRGMSARIPPNTPPGNPATFDSPEASRIDSFIEAVQDKHIDTKRVMQKITEAVGAIADKIDVYLQEELFHGRAAKQTADFLDRELKPLIADMAARGVSMQEFETYLHNRHAEERNIQIAKVNPKYPDGGSGIDTADARAYLAGLTADQRMKFEALARRIDAMTAKTAALKVSGRLESQSTIDKWNAVYGSYVPLHREDMDAAGPGTGAGYSTTGKTKRATGSDKAVENILGNIALDRERTITRAEKNRISNALVALAAANPNKDFWEVDRPPQITYIAQNGLAVTTVDPTFKSHDNVVVARMLDANGEIVERAVIFNKRDERAKRMAESLKNVDAEQLHGAVKFAAGLTRYFAAINTQYNPIFGVVNLTRDIGTGMFNLSTTPIKGHQGKVLRKVIPALGGIMLDLRRHRKGQPRATSGYGAKFEQMQDAGGQTGFRDLFMTGADRGKAIATELKRAQGGGPQMFIETFRWLGGLISDYNTAMENAVRVAAFDVATTPVADGGGGLSEARGASLAKNLTVNFNRKGAKTLNAGALYAFFNASVQGNARLIETLKGPQGAKIILGGVTFGVLQAMALAAAGFDDDEPPEFIKERNIIIPVGGKKYITIPMPQGMLLIPNLGRVPAEFVLSGFRKPGERVRSLFSLSLDSFSPMGGGSSWSQMLSPTILDPVIALGQNEDWTGKPIAREDFNPLAPTPGPLRAKEGATPFSKGLSEIVNKATGGTDYQPGGLSWSPDQIDYLIGQFSGGVGREIGKAATTVAGVATGEEVPPHRIPLVGRFYGDMEAQTGQSARFYENLKEINGHEAEIKGRKEAKEDWQSYRADNPTAALVERANAVERDVSKLRKAKRLALADGADRDEVRAFEEKITEKMRAFNELVKDTR